MAEDFSDLTDGAPAPTAATPRKKRSRAAEPRSNAERRDAPRERVPFGAPTAKLAVGVQKLEEQGYHCHWFNDEDNRIADAEAAWYTPVTYGELNGIGVGLSSKHPDERVSQRVGVSEEGKPIIAYLMKIESQYHQEDEATKFAHDADRVANMKQGINEGENRIDTTGFTLRDQHERRIQVSSKRSRTPFPR